MSGNLLIMGTLYYIAQIFQNTTTTSSCILHVAALEANRKKKIKKKIKKIEELIRLI